MAEGELTQVLVAIAKLEGQLQAYAANQSRLDSEHIKLRADVDVLRLAAAQQNGFFAGGKALWAVLGSLPPSVFLLLQQFGGK